MVTSFPLCLGRHNGEVTSARICQTLGVPRQSRGLTSIELFMSTLAKVVHTYRLRAGTESITELRQHPAPIRYTLVVAFCHERRGEIVDGLIELLVQLVNKIHTNAEKKVVQELLSDVRAVH